MTSTNVNDRLVELGVRYLQRTASELPLLREWLGNFTNDPVHALKEIEVISHRIRGSGAMFGFAELSDAAGEVEMLAADNAARHAGTQAELVAQLQLRIETLNAAVQDAQRRAQA